MLLPFFLCEITNICQLPLRWIFLGCNWLLLILMKKGENLKKGIED